MPGIQRGEFNINVADEAFNATTGIYFADFFRDLPLRHPIQYTYEYYAQYPALGLLHWPPLFHVVEAVVFLVFGPSVVAARATILLFALLGLTFWFRLVNEFDTEWTAAICTVILAGIPSLLLYEKSVMLEVPSLSLCIAAFFYWTRYLRTEEARNAYWFAFFAGLALLTKQQSMFLAPVAFLSLLAARRWRLVFAGPTMRALAICGLLVGPYYAVAMVVDAKSIHGNLLQGIQRISHPSVYYPAALPEKLGIALLAASVLGIVTSFWWKRNEGPVIMLAWILGWYVTFTFIATKDTRYTVYWLPPFVYLAVAPIVAYAGPRLSRPAAAAAVTAVLVSYSWPAFHFQRPYVAGYQPVAQQIVNSQPRGIVLFDGDLAGNFIFFMRASDPSRRFVVLRKALYATQVMPQFGQEELIHSEIELDSLLREYGIEYVVVETGGLLDFKAQQILRDFLPSSRFKLVKSVPIASNTREWSNRNLLVYQNPEAGAPTASVLRVRMMSMSHDIVVPLDTYLHR